MPQIAFLAGGSGAVGPTSGGKIHANNNLSPTPQQLVGGNPQRVSITFHNPGQVDVMIYPGADWQGNPIAATPTALGGCLRVPSVNGYLLITGECQGSWFGFTLAGPGGNPLTIMESNI
jgi:hypothetical protein